MRRAIEVTAWAVGPAEADVALQSAAATVGGTAELLWLPTRVPAFAPDDFAPLGDGATATLDAADTHVDDCAESASFSVYEARVRVPRTNAFADTTLYLSIHDLDEGVEVTVDDRLVRYVRRGDLVDASTGEPRGLTIALLDDSVAPADGDAYRLRLVHVNDCADARPLVVTVHTGDADSADGIDVAGARRLNGCSTAPAPSAALLVVMLCLLVCARRRERAPWTQPVCQPQSTRRP